MAPTESNENGELRLATASDILSTKGRRYAYVPFPELGWRVRIKSLTEKERSRYELDTLKKRGGVDHNKLASAKRRLIQLVCVDEVGNELFTAAQVRELEETDSAVTARLYDEAMRHCGFTEGDIEGLVKNSEPTTAAA